MSIILKRGLEANRATTSVAEGEILFSKDTGRIYIGSGSGNMGGLEIKFAQLTASGIFATTIKVTGTLEGTASWAQSAVTLIGSVQSSSYSATASYLLGSIESASYALTSSFASTAPWSGITSKPALISASAQFTTSSNFEVGLVSSSGMMVQNTEAISRITLVAAGGIATSDAIFSARVSAGTLASPSATLNGHYTNFQMQTFGGSTWSAAARMLMQAAGDHNEGSKPTNIIFSTVPSGSTTLQDRFKINGIGVQVTGSLGVTGAVTASGVLSNLTGTASYATTAATASYVVTAQTASYISGPTGSVQSALAVGGSTILQKLTVSDTGAGGSNIATLLTSVVVSTSTVGGFASYGADGSTNFLGGTLNFRANENWNTTNHGTRLQIRVVPPGSGGVLTEVGSFDNLGLYVSGSITSSGFFGTSSWSSQARTASYVVTAQTASYILPATVVANLVGQRISVADITASAGVRSLGTIAYYGSAGGTINFVASSVTSVINTIGSYYNAGSNFAPLTISAGSDVTTYISGTQYSVLTATGLVITGSVTATTGFTGTSSWSSQARTASYISPTTTLASLQSSGIYSSSAQTVASLVGQNVALTTLTASLISASIISASLVQIDSLTISVSTMSVDSLIVTTGISSSLTGSVLGTASWAVNASTASYVVTANTASYISLATHNNAIVGTGINSGSAQTLVALQGSNINSGSAQTLASLQSSGVVSSSLQFSNTSVFNVGTITASNMQLTNLNVTTITSSIGYASGSNIFGNNQTNTHRFTGSVNITGSLNVTGFIYSTGNAIFEGDTSFGNSSTGKTTQFLSAGATLTITPNNSSGTNGVVYDTGFITGTNGPHIFQVGSIEKARVTSTGVTITGSLINTQGIGWGVTSTATATATSSLTATSTAVQVFTGTLTQQVNLPSASLFGVGIAPMYVIKNRSTGIVTVKAVGSNLIDGVATATLNTTTAITLVSDGVSEWEII